MAQSGMITRTAGYRLSSTENVTNEKINLVAGGDSLRIDPNTITERELADDVLNFTGLVNWEEDDTTFQPKTPGYDLGAEDNEVGDIISKGFLQLGEQTAPATPNSGYGRIYPKTNGLLYFLNDGGTEHDLTAAGLDWWEESGSTFQPKATGYNLGSTTRSVGDITAEGYLQIKEQSAPGTPSTGFTRIYPKTDNFLYYKNEAGDEYDLTNGTLYTEIITANHTLTAKECYGSVYHVSTASTVTLPAIATGLHLTVATVGNIGVSVKPNGSDLIYLDGVALDDGDRVINSNTTGDLIAFNSYSGDGWYAASDTNWSDDGP